MPVIAIYSIKGGVGKTSTAVNLAYLSATSGARTLLWDLDPQGAASFYLRIEPFVKGGIKGVFRKASAKRIKATNYPNFDLLPADWSYRNLDLYFHAQSKPKKQIMRLLNDMHDVDDDSHDTYDYVFVDCPPGFTLVSENILRAADVLLIPVIPTTLSLRTLDQLMDYVSGTQFTNLKVLPFFSMVDRRKRMHRDIAAQSPSGQDVLRSYIPYSSDVEKMGLRREPLGAYAPKSGIALAFRMLWSEITANTVSSYTP